MAHSTQIDSAELASEPKFYLPAGSSPSSDEGPFERTWDALFNHGVRID